MSVEHELEAGLGLPRLQSGAWTQLIITLAISACVVAFFTWVMSDYSATIADAAPLIFSLCTAAQLVWVVSLLGYVRRTARYKATYL